ncbi:hypothetical protein ACFOVU_27800 [Nocardiopsis sediminis]|uniref:Uncharacterized protein n=1 Tax=Nocardiopsis sediminis TaxID=1778267 RepID=A0ABV8FWB0_9ACTN
MRRPPRSPAAVSRPHRVLALLLTFTALAATVLAGTATARSFTPSPLDRDGPEVAADALPRLAFVRARLDDGAGERMQRLFPEGYLFTHVLYGLSRVNTGMLDPGLRGDALAEARWALEQAESAVGRAPFPADAAPAYGVFHAGWTAWLRGRIVELAGGPDAAPDEARELSAAAEELRAAFDAALDDGTPYLMAYPGAAWPVDSVVGIAALRLDDRLRGDDAHAGTIDRWSAAVRDRLDPATGLIPHSADPATGAPLEGARGSSQSLLLRFLAEVDREWAAADHRVFRTTFASTVAMAPGTREFPQGDGSPGDVDSGPLILGLSASASTVALGDAVLFGDAASARALTGLAEASGVPVEAGGQRRYLGGVLPVGDAFLVWSLTAGGEAAAARDATAPGGEGPSPAWRVPWLLLTGTAMALLWWPAVRALHRGWRHRSSGTAGRAMSVG